MKNFKELSENELLTTNGGDAVLVFTIIGAIAAAYGIIREIVRDQGRADAYKAYEDVSSGAGCYENSLLI